MAKQDHPFPFSGKLGKLTFFRSSVDGPMVRERRGPNKDKLLNDPVYVNTRYAMAEFSKAGKAARLIREAVQVQLLDINDARMVSRLTRQLSAVIHTDAINDFGSRTAAHGDIMLMKEFDFNANSFLRNCLKAPYTKTIDRVTGKLTVNIPSFVPSIFIKGPQNATHFRLSAVGGEFDFEAGTQLQVTNNSDILPLDGTPTPLLVLEQQLTANSTGKLMLFLGISFYKESPNGAMQKVNNGAFNAFNIIDVNSI